MTPVKGGSPPREKDSWERSGPDILDGEGVNAYDPCADDEGALGMMSGWGARAGAGTGTDPRAGAAATAVSAGTA